jgi:hypothetical protein
VAKCPNCEAVVRWDDPRCENCDAIFAGPQSWRPIPDTPEEAAQIAGLYPTSTMADEPSSQLPFAVWCPVVAGALIGIVLRLVFTGKPGGAYAAMMVSFIYLCPVLVGAATVYLAERKERRSWWYCIWAPFFANVLFVLGTLIIMVEGLICAVVIVPIFAAVGVVGGLIMGIVCRITRWARHALYSLAVLPLVFGGLEGNVATPNRTGSVERAIAIQAAPQVVWRQIMDARAITPEEMGHAWIFRIGVPLPLAGVVEQSPSGPVRKITMGKDVHFDHVFTAWEENRRVHWTYRLYKDSFPPYALDDHVVVGGYYFDVNDTSYELTPSAEGTQLRIRMGYRVTTQFNWYAEPLARSLLGNFEEVVLNFYRRRSETQRSSSW